MTEASSLQASKPNTSRFESGPVSAVGRRRGGGLYFVSALVLQASALLRYVVLARLLGPEQLGIAATLIVTASFFELIADTGSSRFMVQDRHGGTVEVQNLLQAVAVGRGVMVALGLLIFAIPMAYFYNTPRLAQGMAILSLSPLIIGFSHLDNRRVQRDHDFRAEATSTIISELVGLVAAVVAAWFTRDFTAVLYGVIIRAGVVVLTSHLQAKRPYRLGWDRAHAPRLGRFAAPLMLNGLMVFIASQGDRVIVGHQLGVKALGYYSAVMLLIYYPSQLLAHYLFAINIPVIAAHRDQPIEQERAITNMGGQALLLAIAMAVGFAVVAPELLPLLFGRRFAQAALLVGMIGCLQTTRFLLNWPTTVALAAGRTTTVLMSNMAHGFAFAGAFLGLFLVGGLPGLVGGFIAGELIAVAVALAMVNHNMDEPLFHRFDRLGAYIATFALIMASNLLLGARLWWATAGVLPLWAGLAYWLYRRERIVITDGVASARGAVKLALWRLGVGR